LGAAKLKRRHRRAHDAIFLEERGADRFASLEPPIFLTKPAYLLKCGPLIKYVGYRCPRMKNVYEVLRQKELELARLEKEVEALRVAAPLLSEDKEALEATNNKPTLAATPQQPIRIPQPAVNPAPQPARAAGGWEDTAKRWP